MLSNCVDRQIRLVIEITDRRNETCYCVQAQAHTHNVKCARTTSSCKSITIVQNLSCFHHNMSSSIIHLICYHASWLIVYSICMLLLFFFSFSCKFFMFPLRMHSICVMFFDRIFFASLNLISAFRATMKICLHIEPFLQLL